MSSQINQIYEFGDFRLETAEQLLLRRGEPIQLTLKVFETLLVLVQSYGHLVEKEELMRRIWPDAFVEEANLARNVWTLRRILEDDQQAHRFIETVPKRGYRFIAPVRQVASENDGILIQRRIKARLVHEEIETTDEPKSHVTSADIATIDVPAVRPQLARAHRVRTVTAVAAAAVLIAVVTFAVWSWNSPAPKLESVAILTLRPLNDEPANAGLGLGLTDALITKLAGLRTITVRPTSAVVKFAKSDLDALEVGRRLKTDTVLEGTIQKSEGRIRVTARLLKVNGGDQIWSDKFDEPVSEIFKLQDALANKIARSLALELKKAELEQLNSRPTKSPEAYEDYLRGRYYETQNDEQGLTRSMELFEQAIALDPDFADAHAGLADANLLLYNFGLRSYDEVLPKARQSVSRALQLNPKLAEAYTSLALIQLLADRDWPAAEQSLQKALELDPHNASALLRYGFFLAGIGSFDQALAKLNRASDLDPLSPMVQADIGLVYLCARRYPQAIEELERVTAENPSFSLALWFLAAAYEGSGDNERAFNTELQALQAEGGSDLASRLRTAHSAKGLPAANQLWLEEILKTNQTGAGSALYIASLYAALKDREHTLAWLEKAYREKELMLWQIKYLSRYDFVRDDARFQEILKRLDFKVS